MKCFLLFLVAWLPVFAGQSTILLSETFSYSDGPIVGATESPWAGHSGNTAGQEALVVSGKLQVDAALVQDINAPLIGQPYTTSSGTVLYSSFTVNFTAFPTSGGGYFAHFNSANFRALVWASTSGTPSGFFRLGIGNTTGSTISSGQLTNNLSTNQNYFVVTRYNVASGASTIWLNPVSENDPSVTASDTASTISITGYAFRQASGEGTMLIDDLKVATSFAEVVSTNSVSAPVITTQPQNQSAFVGATVSFEVVASGTSPLNYQWRFNETNLPNANGATLLLTNITSANAGNYSVLVSNNAGSTNSNVAMLTVNEVPPAALSVLSYNTHGNQIEDWSTNSLQVQAIGRQMSYLNPDVITFQEIPHTNVFQMTNFVKQFLSGYFLATNSGTDGFIRSVIASRFPITRSQKWLDGADLKPFGYTNEAPNGDNFTRDLFEAEISVPGFLQPVHIFTTHLKASGDLESRSKRAAEASAISNFFVTGFLTTNANRAYVLTGDLNEDIARPTGSEQTIQRLANAATGLQLTTPLNPFNGSELTFSIQAANMTRRYDYILPSGLLFSNIVSSQIFRTDLLNPLPAGVQTNDSKVASDHLPVLMVFGNPYNTQFQITSTIWSNQLLTLNWQSTSGRHYRVESSTTLTNWNPASQTIIATGTNSTFTTNTAENFKFWRVNRFQ